MRCKGQACSHLICIALHPLCITFILLFSLSSVFFLSSVQLFLASPLPTAQGDQEWEEKLLSCWPEAMVSFASSHLMGEGHLEVEAAGDLGVQPPLPLVNLQSPLMEEHPLMEDGGAWPGGPRTLLRNWHRTM